MQFKCYFHIFSLWQWYLLINIPKETIIAIYPKRAHARARTHTHTHDLSQNKWVPLCCCIVSGCISTCMKHHKSVRQDRSLVTMHAGDKFYCYPCFWNIRGKSKKRLLFSSIEPRSTKSCHFLRKGITVIHLYFAIFFRVK